MANQVSGLRQYVCAGCGGTVLTIAVLRQLEGSLAEHLWTEAPRRHRWRDARCPFCSRLMQPKTIPAGRAAMCKGCEAVWLDKQAVQSSRTKPHAWNRTDIGVRSAQVPQCGAPLANSWDERCQFCGSALHAPLRSSSYHSPAPKSPGWNGPQLVVPPWRLFGPPTRRRLDGR